jgi:transposase
LRERECDPLRLELDRTLKKVGELSMENELLKREKEIVTRRPLPRRRPRS